MVAYKQMSVIGVDKIDPNEGIVIDVRTKMEHAEKRLSFGHTLVTLDELQPTDFMMRHGLDKDFGVYILCRSGMRATQAAEKFLAEGYKNVHVIEGGILACEGHGHALEGHAVNNNDPSGVQKKILPLEQQVRIALGLIAMVGAFLALVAHPLFSLILLMIGGGLVFSGITNWCGVALILTKAPWNKVAEGGASCSAATCSIPTKKNTPTEEQPGQSCQ